VSWDADGLENAMASRLLPFKPSATKWKDPPQDDRRGPGVFRRQPRIEPVAIEKGSCSYSLFQASRSASPACRLRGCSRGKRSSLHTGSGAACRVATTPSSDIGAFSGANPTGKVRRTIVTGPMRVAGPKTVRGLPQGIRRFNLRFVP
jgi:hypothetical protein